MADELASLFGTPAESEAPQDAPVEESASDELFPQGEQANESRAQQRIRQLVQARDASKAEAAKALEEAGKIRKRYEAWDSILDAYGDRGPETAAFDARFMDAFEAMKGSPEIQAAYKLIKEKMDTAGEDPNFSRKALDYVENKLPESDDRINKLLETNARSQIDGVLEGQGVIPGFRSLIADYVVSQGGDLTAMDQSTIFEHARSFIEMKGFTEAQVRGKAEAKAAEPPPNVGDAAGITARREANVEKSEAKAPGSIEEFRSSRDAKVNSVLADLFSS